MTTGKVIGSTYKYGQQNWPYLYPNNDFLIPQLFENYIQTQCTSDYDAYVGTHALVYYGLDKSTNHHSNTDVNNNDDSQSFETHRKNNYRSSCFCDTITTTNTPYSSTLPPTAK